jgi:hypothetical protein
MHVMHAFSHYAVTPELLGDLAGMVEGALRSVRLSGSAAPAVPDARGTLIEIIREKSGPRGIAVEEILEIAGSRGISRDVSLAAIESLIVEDECYQPQKGFVKPL